MCVGVSLEICEVVGGGVTVMLCTCVGCRYVLTEPSQYVPLSLLQHHIQCLNSIDSIMKDLNTVSAMCL